MKNVLISPRFQVSEFVDAVKDYSYIEIVLVGEREIATVERMSSRVKGARKVREQGGPRYAADLGGLLFLLRHGRRPRRGVDPHTFASFRPIIENLVEKNQLKPTALEAFKET